MPNINAHLVGVEFYFADLPAAKRFYQETLGLKLPGNSPDIMHNSTPAKPFSAWRKKAWKIIPRRTKLCFSWRYRVYAAQSRPLEKNA